MLGGCGRVLGGGGRLRSRHSPSCCGCCSWDCGWGGCGSGWGGCESGCGCGWCCSCRSCGCGCGCRSRCSASWRTRGWGGSRGWDACERCKWKRETESGPQWQLRDGVGVWPSIPAGLRATAGCQDAAARHHPPASCSSSPAPPRVLVLD